MILNGRQIASEILTEVRSSLARELVVRAVTAVPSKATESYLAIKSAKAAEAGMRLEVVKLPEDADTDAAIAAVRAPGADAVIVQLPLPANLDTAAILSAIPTEKDADVLSPTTYARFSNGEDGALLPPVAAAVAEILKRANTETANKKIVVIGRGRLVGEPVARWLSRFSTVSVVTRESGDLSSLSDADIIVSGAGQAGLIQPEMLKSGVVLIDAGTSESNGALAGDADPRCAEVASVFTPVPGGVGPIAVACLFQNTALLEGSVKELA